MWSSGIVDALQALAIRAVAVSDGVWISVSVAVTELTKLNLSRDACWVAEVAVRTDLATWALEKFINTNLLIYRCFLTKVTDGAFQADD